MQVSEQIARVSRFYGMSYQDIVSMPYGAFAKLSGHIVRLRAEEIRELVTVSVYPHLKKSQQRRISRSLEKATSKERTLQGVSSLKKAISQTRRR